MYVLRYIKVHRCQCESINVYSGITKFCTLNNNSDKKNVFIMYMYMISSILIKKHFYPIIN